MRVFGITGTNGKTTTAWILGRFLEEGARSAGKASRTGLVTTVIVDTGSRRFSSGYTTPPLEALKAIFAEMRRNKLRNCSMEVSSHAIHQRRTGDTRFAGAGFTNLTQDHLDYHGTMERYFQVKADFFRRLAASTPGAPAAVCTDGEYGKRLARICRRLPLKLVTCGFGEKADVRASNLSVSQDGSEFELSLAGETRRVKCPLAGAYNVENVLVAAALAFGAGVKADLVFRTIPKLKPRWGRLERVKTASEAAVFVDYAHTDDALANVLSTVRSFTPGKVWAVFGAGGDRDRTKRPKMGRAAAANADRIVVTSDNPRSEDPAAIIRDILVGVPKGTRKKVLPDRAEAISWALSHAKKGDSVVICGKGHETTQTIGSKKIPFDDRKVAAAFGTTRGSEPECVSTTSLSSGKNLR